MFEAIESQPKLDVVISLDGKAYHVAADMTVAAAVLFIGLDSNRTTPVSGAKRLPLCMMGVCYECLMVIDGVPGQRACQTYVRDGMVVERQVGESELGADYYEV